jgi:hypothetical protein
MKNHILLIDIDSVIPNLALKKCEIYHKGVGDYVETSDMFEAWADRVYVSSVFEWSKEKTSYWSSNKRAILGGTGWDYSVKLPKEIDEIVPKINIGFTTRGCVRKCEFCFVPKMEGLIRVVAKPEQIWDGRSKELMLLDNNILALPPHFREVCDFVRRNKIKVDFNQGLDLRLLYANQSSLKELQTIRHPEFKFAWDLDDDTMVGKLEWLHDNLGRCTIYVFAGFLPYEKILWKLNELKRMGHNAHLMLHISLRDDGKYKKLRSWTNAHAVFQAMSYDDYCASNGKIDSSMSTITRKSHKKEA